MNLLKNPIVDVRRERDGALLRHPRAEELYVIDMLAWVIWELCDGTKSKEDVVSILGGEGLGDDFEQRVEQYLDYLLKEDLLILVTDHALPEEPFPDNGPSDNHPLATLYLYITDRCNLACQHCWVTPTKTNDRIDSDVSVEEYFAFVDQAMDLGLQYIKITGGEPLLLKYFTELVQGLSKRKLRISLETNGTLINEEIAKILHQAKVHTSVSLDAADPCIHDAFRGVVGCHEAVLKGLRIMLNHDVHPSLIISLCRLNKSQIEPLICLCERLGIKNLKVNFVERVGRANALAQKGLLLTLDEILDLEEAIEEMEQKYGVRIVSNRPCSRRSIRNLVNKGVNICPFTNLLSILSNGDISFCGFGYSYPEWILGNIRDGRLANLWQDHPLLKQARRIPQTLEGICGNCLFRQVCRGGCRAMAMQVYNSIYAPHPDCQELYEHGLFPKSRLRGNQEDT